MVWLNVEIADTFENEQGLWLVYRETGWRAWRI